MHDDPRVLYVIEEFDENEWLPLCDDADESVDVFVTREAADACRDDSVDRGSDPKAIRVVEYIPRFTIR